MSGNSDLVGLIDEADQSLASRSHHHKHQHHRSGSSLFSKLFVLLALPIALYLLFTRLSIDPMSDMAVETELISILQSTQNSLQAWTQNGEPLPPVLPNAALASIVSYEIDGDSYILSAESNGILVTLNSDDVLKTEISQ